MPDLFFYRDPEEADKEEQARQETLAQAAQAAQAAQQAPKQDEDWGEQVTDWSNEPAPGAMAAAPGPAAAAVPKFQVCTVALLSVGDVCILKQGYRSKDHVFIA